MPSDVYKKSRTKPTTAVLLLYTKEKGTLSLKNRDMITLILNLGKEISQEIYDLAIEKLQLHLIQCKCGHSGCLVRHAYYNRKLKRRKGSLQLRVLRLKCQNCGRTHAVLTDQIVPYEQVPLEIQKEMIMLSVFSSELEQIMTENPEITESDTIAVKRRYRKFWKERLAAIGKDITTNLEELVRSAFSSFHRQFMQIRWGINLENFQIHIA